MLNVKVAAAKEMLARQQAEESFYEFCKQAWHIVEGDNPFVEGWFPKILCEHLQAVVNRDIKFLLINAPPRTGKSTILSVMLPAWTWIKKPIERFLYSSYSHNLSIRDSVRCRRVIQSDWFRSRWPIQLIEDQNTKVRFDNESSGYRLSVSFGSATTGDGGSICICDDPNAASDLESKVILETRKEWFSGTFSTRRNDPKNDCLIVQQQRISEADVSGFILKNDPDNQYVKLILPMEYESQRKCKTIVLPSTNGRIWEDPRTKENELLWPERVGPIELLQLKAGLSSAYRVAGQLQQRPAPLDGSILKKGWFKWWKASAPPRLEHVIQSYDTALGADASNCFSACTTWGLFLDENKMMNVILLSLWRDKLEYPELRQMAQNLYSDYNYDKINRPSAKDKKCVPDVVLVEAKASGKSLIQDLQRAGIPAIPFNPDRHGDKIMRVRLISHFIESGRVWLPAKPPAYDKLRDYADLLCEQAGLFPAAESRDLIDTLTQVLLRLRDSGYLTNPLDASMFSNQPNENAKVKTKRDYY